MSPREDIPDEVPMLRIPPHSIEAESSVLGALLLDTAAFDRVADLLSEADFYRFEHRLTFAAIATLANASKPADVVTVFTHLQGVKDGGEVTLAYLNSLAQYVPSAANIRRYAEVVREKSILRKLLAASDEIATKAFSPGTATAAEVLDEAEATIMAISDQRQEDDWHDTGEQVVEFLDWVQAQTHPDPDQRPDYVATGIKVLDDALDGGMRPEEVIVIGARPRMGKTALAMGILEHAALHEGVPVALMSMEMPRAQVTRRRVARVARIPLHKLKLPQRMGDIEWRAMTECVEVLRQVNYHISDKGGLSLNQIRTRARSLKRKSGLRVLAIDYIGLMETDAKENRASALGRISRGIKALAKELKITILLLSQMNRGIEGRVNRRPMLSDLRESGDIEQDADIILFPYREIEDNPKLPDAWKHYGEIIVAKQRDGQANLDLPVLWEGQYVSYGNWDGPKPSKDGSPSEPATRHTGTPRATAPNPL